MKEQILVDMDGVLADVYTQYREFELKDTGVFQPLEAAYGKTEEEAFVNSEKYVNSEGFFRTVPCIPGSVEGLAYLNDKYNVLIVSSATEYPKSLKEKLEWLNENYPFISWKQMIFCGRKDIIKGDIMIDDHPKNLDYFDGRRIIFTQPHNIFLTDNNYKRVNNWEELVSLL